MRTIRIIDENHSYLQAISKKIRAFIKQRDVNAYESLGLLLCLHDLQP